MKSSQYKAVLAGISYFFLSVLNVVVYFWGELFIIPLLVKNLSLFSSSLIFIITSSIAVSGIVFIYLNRDFSNIFFKKLGIGWKIKYRNIILLIIIGFLVLMNIHQQSIVNDFLHNHMSKYALMFTLYSGKPFNVTVYSGNQNLGHTQGGVINFYSFELKDSKVRIYGITEDKKFYLEKNVDPDKPRQTISINEDETQQLYVKFNTKNPKQVNGFINNQWPVEEGKSMVPLESIGSMNVPYNITDKRYRYQDSIKLTQEIITQQKYPLIIIRLPSY